MSDIEKLIEKLLSANKSSDWKAPKVKILDQKKFKGHFILYLSGFKTIYIPYDFDMYRISKEGRKITIHITTKN